MDSHNRKILGEMFPSYPMSVVEQTRIAQQLLSGGLQKHILTRYAAQTPPYKLVFEKKEKIPGFRQGVQAYHKQAIPRLIQHLNDPDFPNYEFCWEIYKCAATKYVGTELSKLDKLLGEVPYDGANNDSGDLIKTICVNAFEFDVKPEDVRILYEVWWIDRIPNIEELLVLCSKPDELRIQAKAIRSISDKIDLLDTKLKDITLTLTAASTAAAQEHSKILEHGKQIASHETLIDTLVSQAPDVSSIVAAEISSKVEPIDEKLYKLSSQLNSLSTKVGTFTSAPDLKSELKRVADENMAAIEKAKQEYVESLNELIAQNIGERIDGIEKKLSAMADLRNAKPPGSTGTHTTQSSYKSPLSAGSPQRNSSFKITKEVEFLNNWAASVAQLRRSSFGFEQIVSLHSLFLANNIIVSDLALASSWVDCLGWRQFTKHLVASPTWSSEEDWSSGAEHLFGNDASNAPKVLLIHNYDMGLVDCYLAPTLVLWALNEAPKRPWTKLFLIPSLQSLTPSYQVLNHSAYAIFSKEQLNRLQLADGFSAPTSVRQSAVTGVDPKIASQWLQPAGGHDYDLETIQKSLNIELSDWLVSNFRRTVAQSTKYLQESSAVGLGMSLHILPWVRSRYGDSEVGALDAYLRQLPDVVL